MSPSPPYNASTPPFSMSPPFSVSSTCIPVESMDRAPIACGGFSDLYRGKYKGVIVAIKVPRVPQTRSLVNSETRRMELDMVFHEAEMLAAFPHPNIVQLTGLCDGRAINDSIQSPRCLILPFAMGGDAECLFKNKDVGFAKETKLRILVQVGEALETLHNRGVVHGDVKPRNVLLDRGLNAKLCDFTHSHCIGVALPYEPSYSRTYAAPELLKSEEIITTTQSDVFAFGRSVCAIMTGEQPSTLIHWRPRAFSSLGPLVSLVDRCLEISPCKRPTMAQVVIALQTVYGSV